MSLKKLYKSIKHKLKSNDLIEASFLVPVTEDKDIGTGNFHPKSRWLELEHQLFKIFKGYTLSKESYDGCWESSDTHKAVRDSSRKYFVALRVKYLKKLRTFLKITASTFRQKEIYFVRNGKVEFIQNDLHKKLF